MNFRCWKDAIGRRLALHPCLLKLLFLVERLHAVDVVDAIFVASWYTTNSFEVIVVTDPNLPCT
jgi:hypothetical protein